MIKVPRPRLGGEEAFAVLDRGADLAAHRGVIQAGEVAPVVVHRPGRGLFETEREAHERAVPGPGFPYDGDKLAQHSMPTRRRA